MYSSWVISQPTKSTVVDTGIRLGAFLKLQSDVSADFFLDNPGLKEATWSNSMEQLAEMIRIRHSGLKACHVK